ncbi:hypothetical protein [Yoonia sp.]|uniref:hypothetical protein n=1 Tax=Yoonia sp. TaxID=2212373 RepID=UPI0019DA82B2|nr:hypothetical protein [Yoonia sp.]MBE0413069.1 hypothetical protein [Yoonia sp.]
MRPSDNLHSQIVGWAKIILPLAALGLLSTLFLLARSPSSQFDIPFAEIAEIARDQRIISPQFSGLTDEGAIVTIAARSAQPDAVRPDTVQIDALTMRMENLDGSTLVVSATRGELDGRDRIARFMGLARLETSTGFEMETNGLIAELDTGVVTSDGLLEIRAPFGELTAGKVTFKMTQDQTGQQMLFTDGVRLIYRPQID